MTTQAAVETFEVLMEDDEGGFHVWCPALKGCHSFGETRELAMANIREAIEGWLEGAGELGIPILHRETLRVDVPSDIKRLEPTPAERPNTRTHTRSGTRWMVIPSPTWQSPLLPQSR